MNDHTPQRYPSEPMLYDAASRQHKAHKIAAILRHALGDSLALMRCLDVGCASGLVTRHLAQACQATIGLEYDAAHVAQMGDNSQPGLLLIQGDAQRLPLADSVVDLVICAQVYEHVADADRLAAEIWRVLRAGGVCFFSGPNRLDPIERHYGLPFVSWLPRRWADGYLRLLGRGQTYTEHPRTMGGLQKLWAGFEITDYTIPLITEPQAFGMHEVAGIAWARRLPAWLLRALLPCVPNYNWVLRKPDGGQHANHRH